MTEITMAQDPAVLVAIDIAKARHEVLIAAPGKKRRRRLTVLNSLADFNRMRCLRPIGIFGVHMLTGMNQTGFIGDDLVPILRLD